MKLSNKRLKVVLSAVILLLAAGALLYAIQSQKTKMRVESVGVLPEEYAFKIKTDQYINVDETASKENLKTKVMKKIGLAPERLQEAQLFYVKLTVRDYDVNNTMLGVEYSNMVFLDIHLANTKEYPLLFTYNSPADDEKTLKRYLLNASNAEIAFVGIVNEITATRNSPRSILDSIRLTLHNTSQSTEKPLETLDYRIMVCGKWGC